MFDIDQIDGDSQGLCYSIVDITLDGGLGDIIEKNKPIYYGNCFEKMQTLRHGNGRDWWIFIMKNGPGDSSICFIKFLVTPYAIEGPYEQLIETETEAQIFNFLGQMKFSPNGEKLAITWGNYFNLYDVDRCSGLLSNYLSIDVLIPNSAYLYGCEFSPDSRRLYLTDYYSLSGNSNLYQYCINCPISIFESKKVIFEFTGGDYRLAQLQLGMDEKIYISTFYPLPSDLYTKFNQNLSVVQNPNGDSATCNLDTFVISLGKARCTAALPNLPNYNLGALEGSACDTLTSVISQPVLSELQVFPNPASNFLTISVTDETLLLANLNAITITTLSGGVVKTIRQPKSLTIYTADLTAGFYLVTLTFQSGEAQKFKVIIQ